MKAPSRFVLAIAAAASFATAALAVGPRYRIEVAGLACPFCAYGIEKKLGAIEGVERVETDIKEGAVFVVMKDGTTLDKARAKQAVKDAGFTLKRFEQTTPDEAR